MPVLLSICIPTYNRPEELINTLELVFQAWNKDAEIIVIDNASDIDMESHCRSLLNFTNVEVKFLRNPVNIGAGGNIARVVEHASGDYIWVLSDDDQPSIHSVELICSILRSQPNIGYINFQNHWSGPRKNNVFGTGLSSYLKDIENFGGQLFISANVFRKSEFLKYIRYAYIYGYSMAGHYAVFLMMLKNHSNYLLSSERIAEWGETVDWHRLHVSMGVMTLLELPLDLNHDEFKRFAHTLASTLPNDHMLLRALLSNQVLMPHWQAHYIYNQILSRSKPGRLTPLRDLKYCIILNLLLLMPCAVLGLLQKVWEFRSKRNTEISFEDSNSRF